jgi:hypothetical protein
MTSQMPIARHWPSVSRTGHRSRGKCVLNNSLRLPELFWHSCSLKVMGAGWGDAIEPLTAHISTCVTRRRRNPAEMRMTVDRTG